MIGSSDIPTAKFSVGQLIHHRLFDYRGVIVDVDETFQGTDQWYQAVAKSRPPKDKPWYHILVDGSDHTTYVAERNLQMDDFQEPIEHPMVERFFSSFSGGKYQTLERLN
jgi:heat shock protein HspQ